MLLYAVVKQEYNVIVVKQECDESEVPQMPFMMTRCHFSKASVVAFSHGPYVMLAVEKQDHNMFEVP